MVAAARGARRGHLVVAVVAILALALQTWLVVAGQDVVGSAATGVPIVERLRRLVSYFTIQSNVLVAAVSLVAASGRARGRWFAVARLASLVGITVTAIVAGVALAPPATYTAANLVCDRLLHVVVPALTLLVWIVFGPRGDAVGRDLPLVLIWPAVWLAATLALGPVVRWYPYPFLDPARSGAAAVAIACAGIAVLFLAVGAALVWADRHLPRRPVP